MVLLSHCCNGNANVKINRSVHVKMQLRKEIKISSRLAVVDYVGFRLPF